MSEYIAKETLEAEIRRQMDECNPMSEGRFYGASFLATVECAPAADVAQVVHGRWEQRKTPLGKTYSICSNCSTDFKFKTDKGTLARLDMDGMPYCPNCGCKMDKEDET